MQFPIIAGLVAATTLAMPTEPVLGIRDWTSPELGLHVRNAGYQGDGFYLAVFNESGVANVQFTPMSDLPTMAATEVLSTRYNNGVTKRAGTECSGRVTIALEDLVEANLQLANNAESMPNQGDFHHWGWVHHNQQTAYFCNYQTNSLTKALIQEMQNVVAVTCGANAYGFDRRTNGGGANDLAVGITFTGDHFCTSDFYG